MLQKADTIGMFQVESRAQMATLPRLKAEDILRPRRRSRDHPAGADRRPDGASVSDAAARAGAGGVSASVAGADSRAHARRAALPGAAAADGDGRGGFSGGEAEELRRAIGFKRSEKRMQKIEGSSARGWRSRRSPATPRSEIIHSITSFALYGFPESHAASFALLVYASAYLKAHYPCGVLHGAVEQPADGVLSPVDAGKGRAASRRPLRADRRAGIGLGVRRGSRRRRAARADVCEWVAPRRRTGDRGGGNEAEGLRLEIRGSRGEVGGRRESGDDLVRRCPKCGCDDESMIEAVQTHEAFCNVCSHVWTLAREFAQSMRPLPLLPGPPASSLHPPTASLASVRSTTSSAAPGSAATKWRRLRRSAP